jgi:hypothetical protein
VAGVGAATRGPARFALTADAAAGLRAVAPPVDVREATGAGAEEEPEAEDFRRARASYSWPG